MRVAVIGSRNLQVADLENYLPGDTSCIVTGGARGVDTSARIHARRHGIPLREFLPDYNAYGYLAPLIRNSLILEHADLVLAFWDGYSRGTAYVIKKCREKGIECRVFMQKKGWLPFRKKIFFVRFRWLKFNFIYHRRI